MTADAPNDAVPSRAQPGGLDVGILSGMTVAHHHHRIAFPRGGPSERNRLDVADRSLQEEQGHVEGGAEVVVGPLGVVEVGVSDRPPHAVAERGQLRAIDSEASHVGAEAHVGGDPLGAFEGVEAVGRRQHQLGGDEGPGAHEAGEDVVRRRGDHQDGAHRREVPIRGAPHDGVGVRLGRDLGGERRGAAQREDAEPADGARYSQNWTSKCDVLRAFTPALSL